MYSKNNPDHLQSEGWISDGYMYYYEKMFLKSFFTVNNTDLSSLVKAFVSVHQRPLLIKNGHYIIEGVLHKLKNNHGVLDFRDTLVRNNNNRERGDPQSSE